MWVPKVRLARRIAAHLHVAHRENVITMNHEDRAACLDAITNPYVSRTLCRKMSVLWSAHGTLVLAWHDNYTGHPLRPKTEDVELARVLDYWGP